MSQLFSTIQWILGLPFLSGYRTYLSAGIGGALAVMMAVDAGIHDNRATEAIETVWLPLTSYYGLVSAFLAASQIAQRAAIQSNKPSE